MKTKKLKRFLALIGAMVLMSSLLSACTGGGDDPEDAVGFGVEDPNEDPTTYDKYKELENGDITILYHVDPDAYDIRQAMNPNYYDAVVETIPKYEEKYGAKVNFIPVAWNDMQETLVKMVNSNEAPDLAMVYDETFTANVQSGNIQNISSYVGELDYAFWDVSTDLFSWKEQLYAIPVRPFPFYMVFNRDLFLQAGVEAPDELWKKGEWTFDKFAEVCNAVTVWEGGEMTKIGFGSWRDAVLSFMWANEGSMLNVDSKNGKVSNGMNTNNTKVAMDYLSRWIKQNSGFMAFTTDDYDILDSFEGGDVGIVRNIEYPVLDFEAKFETGMVPFPKGPNATSDKVSVVYPQAMVVPTGAKNIQGAVAFTYMANQVQATEGAENDRKRFGDEYYEMLFGDDVKNVYAYDKASAEINTIIASMINSLFDGVPAATVISSQDAPILASIEKRWGSSALS